LNGSIAKSSAIESEVVGRRKKEEVGRRGERGEAAT
jgi:hypothetical protein